DVESNLLTPSQPSPVWIWDHVMSDVLDAMPAFVDSKTGNGPGLLGSAKSLPRPMTTSALWPWAGAALLTAKKLKLLKPLMPPSGITDLISVPGTSLLVKS